MTRIPFHFQMSSKTRRTGTRQAFTMLEILIAVVIVGVLVMLGIGGYQRVIGMAQGAQNLSNHRIIVAGLLAYSLEYKGRLPYNVDYNPPFHMDNSYSPWPKTLCVLGYVSDGSVFFSPKFWPRWGNKESAQLVIRNPQNYPNSIVPWGYPNYGANRYGAMPNSQGDSRTPANLFRVAGDGNLSRLMLIRDTYDETYDKPPSILRGGGTHWFANASTIPKEEDCYAGIVHASFADGHVEGFRREKMVELMGSGTTAPMFYNIYTTD